MLALRINVLPSVWHSAVYLLQQLTDPDYDMYNDPYLLFVVGIHFICIILNKEHLPYHPTAGYSCIKIQEEHSELKYEPLSG
jgi:hypothetical protein